MDDGRVSPRREELATPGSEIEIERIEVHGKGGEQVSATEENTSEVDVLRAEINEYRRRYDDLTSRMLENNRALSVLARNLEESRLDGERRIIKYVLSLVAPVIDRLESKSNLTPLEHDILISLQDLQALKVGDGKENSLPQVLTESEMRIAALIKNGLTNDEIAARLNISSHTVRTHRRNIRRKLELNKTGQNLRTYLKSRMQDKPTPKRRASDWS